MLMTGDLVQRKEFHGSEKLNSYAFLDAGHIIAIVTVDDTIQMQVYRLEPTRAKSEPVDGLHNSRQVYPQSYRFERRIPSIARALRYSTV